MVLENSQVSESDKNASVNHDLKEKENKIISNIKNNSPIKKNEKDSTINELGENEFKNNVNENTYSEQSKDILKVENLEENYLTTKKKQRVRKRITIADSDSENDLETGDFEENEDILDLPENTSDSNKGKSVNKSKKRVTMFQSDSEDELEKSIIINKSNKQDLFNNFLSSDSEVESLKPQTSTTTNKIRKKFNFDDSDSDIDKEVTPHNKSFSDRGPEEERPIYTVDSKGKLVAENLTIKSSKWEALCDSESSGPENSDDNETSDREQKGNNKNSHNSEDEIIKPITYKRKKKLMNEDKQHQLTSKEAAKQREEIRSESQRMRRESNISLPYHRPKTFTLKEFLSRRPKFACAVPLAAKTPPSIAIKMSAQQLEIISKKLEERHKEVKEFYKSDSEVEDLEDKDDEDYVPLESENEDEKCDNKSSKTLHDDCGSDNKEQIESKSRNVENINKVQNIGVNHSDVEVEQIEKSLEKIQKDSDVEKIKIISEHVIRNATENCSNEIETSIEGTENLEKITNNGKMINIISDYTITNLHKNNFLTEEKQNTDPIENKLSNGILPSESNENDVVMEELIIENKSDDNFSNIPEREKIEESTPMDYEFNLDDLEENSEKIIDQKDSGEATEKLCESQADEKTSENHKDQFHFGEIDEEIENFCKKDPPVLENPISKLEQLKERLSNIKPRLSGGPNHIIDLENIAKPNEVTKLMERFAQHTAKKVSHKDRVKLNIVSVEHGGEIHKETVAVNVDNEEDTGIEERPGVRLQRLRNELQSQIAQRKSEIWQQRATTKEINQHDDPYDGEKSECGADDGILDDDEEEEMSESSEEEEYLEEEKPKNKSAFVDDEADAEDDYEENGSEDDRDELVDKENKTEEDKDEEANDEEDKDEDDEEDKDEESDGNEGDKLPHKKPLKRIVKGFTEDSDEDEDIDAPGDTIKKIAEKLNRSNEGANNSQDDYIRPYQLQNQNNKTPVKSFSEGTNSELKFLTPVSYITGLQNLTNSASKANVPSPLREADWHTEFQRKLHANSIITNSQAEAMMDLCSENFSESQDLSQITQESIKLNTKPTDITVKIHQTVPPNTQDILNICSGEFDESSSISIPSTLPPSTQDLLNICSGEFTGVSQVPRGIPNSVVVTHKLDVVDEMKSLGEDQDMIISQLINEEEMEAFKKKFDSPVMTHAHRIGVEEEEVEEVLTGGGIIDSDEDCEVLEVKKKRKNQKKLTFSDDESSDEEEEKEEEIDLHDCIEEDEADVPGEINYDSEENEVDYIEEKGKTNIKMTDFFEDEAELSESEWGSADEDEKDLDDLEFEQGDKEKFDEKQLKTDLERIHMRRMLDDDTREVKLLQEMLLDDGELHGTGRERQFRWKNIDSAFPEDGEKKLSDDENHLGDDDEESEEQWRRKRHEREMFLKEKNSQETKDDLSGNSEILKIGHKVIERSVSNLQDNNVEKSATGSSPAVKRSFSLLQKRGSFLNRGDQVLERLAGYNKTTTVTSVVAGKAAKNSKHFLFQTVAQETTTSFLNLKRRGDDGTPKVIKKLRLSDNLSPALSRKRKHDKQIKMKLFGIS